METSIIASVPHPPYFCQGGSRRLSGSQVMRRGDGSEGGPWSCVSMVLEPVRRAKPERAVQPVGQPSPSSCCAERMCSATAYSSRPAALRA
jgi:hypothetical protein